MGTAWKDQLIEWHDRGSLKSKPRLEVELSLNRDSFPHRSLMSVELELPENADKEKYSYSFPRVI